MRSIYITALFACVGLYTALLILPRGDEHSAKILTACFNFGWFEPLTWYTIILSIWYIPVPLFVISGITIKFYMQENKISPSGIVDFIHELREIAKDESPALSAKVLLIGFIYFFVTVISWIAYASSKGV